MQAPAGRSTVNISSSKTLTTTSVSSSSSPSGSKKYNTTVPTIAFIGMPTTTTIKPKLTQISEPLTKANSIATTIHSASVDEALKTPTILKSILKSNESFNTHSPKAQKIIAKTNLHLNVSKSSKINEIQKEVVIKPKKPAPKSPQNPSYIPVYVPKLLTSGSPVKNNENIVGSDDNHVEVVEHKSTVSVSEKTRTSTTESTVVENTNETSVLESLTDCREIQETTRTSTNISTEDDTVDSTIEEIVPSSEGKHKSESDGSETACEEYIDNQLDEFLAHKAASIISVNKNCSTVEKSCEKNNTELSQIYVNEEFKRNESIEELHDESHYLPMTPKRKDFGHGGDIFTLSLNDSTADEENPYVEMTKFLQDEEAKTSYEVMCIGKSNLTPLGKGSEKIKKNEPLYMELPGTKNLTLASTAAATKEEIDNEQSNSSTGKSILKKCKKGGDNIKKKVKKTSERVQNKRKDLPDILKPSQSTINMSSDSSDADDESSKQIDLKKMRSRTRFSLSDTFRPASYYLGASTPLNNCAESSDSEIVSPPPIPASPPPIDELKTEEIFSSENYDTVKRRDSNSGSKMDLSCGQLPKIHSSNISLNLPKAESTLKSSRLSLPDHLSKNRYSNFKASQSHLLKHHERTLSDSNYSFQTDNSSNTSSDFDLYNKLRLTTPSFQTTPIRYQSNSSLPQKYITSGKAIMVIGDSSEAESVELRNIQTSDSELEKHRSRRPLSRESIEAIELLNEKFEERMPTHDLDTYLDNLQTSDLQLYQNSAFETRVGAGVISNLIKPPEIFRNKDDEKFYGDIKFASSLDSLQKGEQNQKQELNFNLNDHTPTSTDHEQTTFYTPMHSRNNSNLSEQSAPYYYSQINSSREMLSTPTTLNNQRDIHAHGSNIKHIHNQIEKPNISVEMLAEKYQTLDNKNLYKSNVEKLTYSPGKNLKTNDSQHAYNTSHMFYLEQVASPPIKMSNFHTNKQNHAIIPDSPSHIHLTTSQMVRNIDAGPNGAKSTNITMAQVEHLSGGGVDNDLKTECKLSSSKATEELCMEKNTSKVASKISPFLGAQNSGERLWEEDTLWRESLRKVSQRHAKSLDDLDCIATSTCPVKNTLKAKLTRDVTYVNDHVSQHMRANLNKPLIEKNSIKTELHERHINPIRDEDDQLSANDVYVQLMQQRIEHAEEPKTDDIYEMLREDTSSTMSHKSAEIDRETIRQWDAMSSGINTKNFPSSNSSNNNIETSIDSSSEQSPTSPLSVHAIVQQLNAKNPTNIIQKAPPKP